MKNLHTYISPDKKFNEEHSKLVNLQIDNSLELGWEPKEIILATNFPYEYKGIKSTILPDDLYYPYRWTATKTMVIEYLLSHGMIDDLTWYHDFDCYQLSPFIYIDDDMKGINVGICQYGRMPRLCSASMFFRPEAREFFTEVKNVITENRFNEEFAIMRVLKYSEADGILSPDKYKVAKLNITYALHRHNFNHVYHRARKPIMAVHCHPTPDKVDVFIKGINKANLVVFPDHLIRLFKKYEYF